MTDTSDRPPAVPLVGLADRAELVRLLSEQRERSGRTVREVARECGLPLSTVGGYLSGKHLPARATQDQFARLLTAIGVRDDELDGWLQAVARLRRLPGPRTSDAVSPYRGLTAFDVADAPLYAGRERLVRTLLARVTSSPSAPVVVLGASGAGKSSLLRAGLVASLRASGRRAVVVTPGPDPLAALDQATFELTGGSDDPAGGVLVVDQFEEALPPDVGNGPRSPWNPALVDRIERLHTTGVVVVLGMRADVVGRALDDERLASGIADRPVPVGAMSTAELRRTVVEPARAVGLEVDDDLVASVVADATRGSSATATGDALDQPIDPGALPLVSHALYATWAASRTRRLTLDRYVSVGRLAGAIAQTAEQALADLAPEGLDDVRQVLLRLVDVRGSLLTSGTVPLTDLDDDARDTVDLLVDARLLTLDDQGVRIAHETLLTAWPRLAGWIAADRLALVARGRLDDASRAWTDADRQDDLLYRGAQLAAVELTLKDAPAPFGRAREFLDASLALRDRQELARRRSRRRLRVLAAGLAVLALSTSGLATYAVAAQRTASRQRDEAVSRQLAVTSARLAATDPALAAQVAVAAYAESPTTTARSALLSSTGSPVPVRLGQVNGTINGLATNPAGTLLATATDHGSVQLWSVGGPARPLQVLADMGDTAVYRLAFTPDGARLAAGGDGGQLRLWDVADPSRPRVLPVSGDPVKATLYDVVTSADGRLVVAGASDGTVHLWRLDDAGATPVGSFTAFSDGTVQALSLDSTGRILAAAGTTDQVGLWNVSDPGAPVALGSPVTVAATRVTSLAFSPGGHTVAAGSLDGTVRLLDVSIPRAPVVGLTLTGPASWINDLAFSPDGTRLAAASSDKMVWVWDPTSGARAGELRHSHQVVAVRWSPDGDTIYSAGADGLLRGWAYPGPTLGGFSSAAGQGTFGDGLMATASVDGLRLWDIDDPTRVHLLGIGHPPDGARLDGAVAVSGALHLAVAGDTKGRVHAWDITDPMSPRLVASVQAHTDWVETLAFDRTGRRLAASSDDGTVTTWDMTDGLPSAPAGRLDLKGGYVYVVAWAPDGRTLVASDLNGTIRLVDATDLSRPKQIGDPITGPKGQVTGVAFDSDGKTVAAVVSDGTTWLWDVSDRTAPTVIGTPISAIGSTGFNAAFSPDGTLLAIGMTDGTVQIWDVSTRTAPVLFATVSGPDGTVYGVEFSPDGTHLSAGAADRTVRLWDVRVSGARAAVCAAVSAGIAMTADEWTGIAGDLRQPPTCG